jgi:ketosteroid isomerase-like protein
VVGTYRGKEAILTDIFGPLREKLHGRNTCLPMRIHADGDFVVVEAKGQNQLKDGRRYDNEYCFVIRMRDGQMVEITEYLDTELVSDRLGTRI